MHRHKIERPAARRRRIDILPRGGGSVSRTRSDELMATPCCCCSRRGESINRDAFMKPALRIEELLIAMQFNPFVNSHAPPSSASVTGSWARSPQITLRTRKISIDLALCQSTSTRTGAPADSGIPIGALTRRLRYRNQTVASLKYDPNGPRGRARTFTVSQVTVLSLRQLTDRPSSSFMTRPNA